MSEMVERVARHIAGIAWGDLDEDTRQFWLARARAAIMAMRDPTREMLMLGYKVGTHCDHMTVGDYGRAWRAMIDAALANGTMTAPTSAGGTPSA